MVSLQPIPVRCGQATMVMKQRNKHLQIPDMVDEVENKEEPKKPKDEDKDKDEDEDEDEKSPQEQTKKKGKRKETPPKKRRSPAKKPSNDVPSIYWVEVLFPPGNKWIPVDIVRQSVACASLMEPPKASAAFNTLTYVLALESVSDHIKDVTLRYASKYQTQTKKLRDDPWFLNLMKRTSRQASRLPEVDRLETEWLQQRTKSESLPTSIQAFNNHPDYVLERHLKKYEYLYPKDPSLAVGQVRGENIYPRSLVQMLHTADKWLSLEARVIKFGEEPVKVVKSRQMPARKSSIRDLSMARDESDDEDVMVSGQGVADTD